MAQIRSEVHPEDASVKRLQLIEPNIAAGSFYCPKLRATIARSECVVRQDRLVVSVTAAGHRYLRNTSTQDRHCRGALESLPTCALGVFIRARVQRGR